MQPTKRKGSNRKKEAKPENQVKISNFLIKSIVNPTSNESEDPEETKTTSASEYQSDLQVGTRSPAQKTDDRPIREVIVIESSPIRPYIHRSSPIPSESHRGSPPMSSLKQLHVRTTTPTNPPKTVHPFFAPRAKKMVISPIEVSPITPNRAIHVQYSSALWPDRENIHCGYETAPRGRSADSIYHNRPRPVKKTSRVSSKSRRRGEFGTVDELTEQPFNRVPLETYSDREVAVDHIEEKYRSHPALSRLISDEPLERPQYQLWNDKFSPRRKADILHNTDKAEYLYGWMKALEIQVEGEGQALGPKPPQVVIQRAVDKRRKRRRLSDDSDDIEDFIADDDDDEGANDDESMWDEDGNESEINDLLSISEDLPIAATTASSTLSSREPSPFPTFQLSNLGTRSRPSARKIINSSPVASPPVPLVGESPKKILKDTLTLPSLTERLANTIILHGPAGSGKTATIYACAEELHWKIFEFYPGLGKRSGAGFMLEMGGTGDNHRVGGLVTQEVRERDTRPSPSLGFLASPSKKARNPPSQMSEQPSTQSSDVHQSLVLIEEGDIMFQSDVNFWPTLVNFIRSSRRPVIITCNDLGLVPVEDLPLQAILEFKSCDVGLAVSYLQAIGVYEGHYIKKEVAHSYYTRDAMYHPLDADVPDQPMHPYPSQDPLVVPDLKRSINALQFLLTTKKNISVPYETNLAAFSNWPHRPAVMPELVIGTEDGHFRRSAPQEDLETLIHLSELVDSISFSDAFIDRRLKDSLQEGSIDRYRPSSDDTQGHTLLCKVEEPEEAVFTSALRPREDDMALWVAYHARVRFEQRGHGQIARRDIGTPLGLTTLPQASIGLSAQAASLNMTELAMDRAKYQAKVVHALDEGISLQSPLLPSPGCILDYMPWMREIARGAQGKLGWMSPEGRNVLIGDGLVSPKHMIHITAHFDLEIYPKLLLLKNFMRAMRKVEEIKVARRFSPLPSLAALAFSNPSPTVFAADGAPLTLNPHSAFSSYKSQLPTLSVDPVSRPAPSGRPGSPFSFGNPPEYSRVSSAYNQSAERQLVPENMDTEQQDQSRGPPSSYQQRLQLEQDSDQYPEGFNYAMRRHSIAALQSSNSNHVLSDPRGPGQRSPFHPNIDSMKKISHGSMIYGGHTPVESEFPDTYRSPMDPEPPKRRGSAFDTRGIAQMSLNERRDSIDTRFVPPGPNNWWDRRDSTTSLYSNTSVSSVGGYASSFSGESKQWPPQRTPQPHIQDTLPPNARPFPSLPDPRTPTANTHGPSPYDRRMSVPDASIAAGAVRNLRSRSRPPSRGVGSSQNVTPPHLPQITATLVTNEQYQDSNIGHSQQQTPVSAGSASGMLNPKDSASTTPYSRSPELRVSHKLAERKRRKEMKDLFDELRDNLPADRGMKSSKWEILTKAIEYIAQIRTQQQDLLREIDTLKAEVEVLRGGPVPSTNGHHYGGSMAYQQGGYNATTAQSRTSSHYPASGPVPPPL